MCYGSDKNRVKITQKSGSSNSLVTVFHIKSKMILVLHPSVTCVTLHAQNVAPYIYMYNGW